ncbi:hypothetical protein QYE76_046674 [Lolium multiflorum]|uniref:Uncharacterized protein n=1 Tax=Lolium multiflorum TaxID=4521 RepID=A0AAD8TQE3_LOLMU|nr:hypothetical protein QYE76_046674 [Lolium multiflorum]
MKAEILEEVKKEIEKMLNAGFIGHAYAEWISNVVPVEKKDGRWRVAIDFRNLNNATPKDEYPMPVADIDQCRLVISPMSDSIEDVTELLWSLEKIKENKAKVVYNKKGHCCPRCRRRSYCAASGEVLVAADSRRQGLHLPHRRHCSSSDPARKRLAGGYLGGGVLLRLFFLLFGGEVPSHEKRSSSLCRL